jgi:hypothetical protein
METIASRSCAFSIRRTFALSFARLAIGIVKPEILKRIP